MSPDIDIKKLKSLTRKALTNLKTHEAETKAIAISKDNAAEEELFQRIIKGLPAMLETAALEGKHTVDVWEMGDFGHRNSDEVTEETPINWNLMNRLEKYCQDNQLQTKIDKRDNHDHGANYFSKEHIFYVLSVSWPI